MIKNDDTEPNDVSQQVKNKVTLMWILSVFFSFIPGLLLYRFKKSDPYIQAQSREALNWSVTTLVGILIATLLSFVVGSFLIPLVGVVHFVFCLKGAVAAWLDEDYHVPIAWRWVK